MRDVAGGGVGGVDEVLEGSYVTTERKEEEDEEATGVPSTCTCGEGVAGFGGTKRKKSGWWCPPRS